jgi:hypothetical protein
LLIRHIEAPRSAERPKWLVASARVKSGEQYGGTPASGFRPTRAAGYARCPRCVGISKSRLAPIGVDREEIASAACARRYRDFVPSHRHGPRAHSAPYACYNPVKHGYIAAVAQCPYSTFHRWVKMGVYPATGPSIGPATWLPASLRTPCGGKAHKGLPFYASCLIYG